MHLKRLQCSVLVVALVCLYLVLLMSTVSAEVTLAGGGKKYGGVFVGGWDSIEYNRKLMEDNLTAYQNHLLELENSGWTEDMMAGGPPDIVSVNSIKAAINRFKPGGAKALVAGDEFQFFYIGHGPYMYVKDGPDEDEFEDEIKTETLAEWLSGFPKSVTVSIVFDSCSSKSDTDILAKLGIKDADGDYLDANHLCLVWAAEGATNIIEPSGRWFLPDWLFGTTFLEALIAGIEGAVGSDGKAIASEVVDTYVSPQVKESTHGDNDNDGKSDEDGSSICHEEDTPPDQKPEHDDDGDSKIDEDPSPQDSGCRQPQSVTLEGFDISVSPHKQVMVNFAQVISAGLTDVTETRKTAYGYPENYNIMEPTCSISTTAEFSGLITIGFAYDEIEVHGDETKIKLFHWTGSRWEDCTTSVDTVNNKVTGQVTSLSPFAVGYPVSTSGPVISTGYNTYWLGASALGLLLAGAWMMRRAFMLKS